MRLADVMRETTPWCAESLDEVASIFTAFVARKRSLGLLDFDDLLLYWRVAAQDDALGEELGAAYDHILVDEFQDVNLLQLDVLVGLRRIDPRLTIVGDDAQAIYGFRGATARFLLDAEDYFNDLTTITLDVNYRSSGVILGVANAIAADAPEGFSSVLREVVPITGASQPLLVHCADERDQSESVADRVLEFYEQGTALQKQAVLFRAAHHSGDLEIELARRRIPFVKYGGLRYLEAAHVKDLLAAFRLADILVMRWRGSDFYNSCPEWARPRRDGLSTPSETWTGISPCPRRGRATMVDRRRRVAERSPRNVA